MDVDLHAIDYSMDQSNPQNCLNPIITLAKSSHCGHQPNLLEITLTTKTNPWSTIFTKDVPIANVKHAYFH
jgi:hypothetical protein